MRTQYSRFHEIAREAKGLEGELVIDAHSHIGGLAKWYHLPDSTTEGMVAEMDRLGVDLAVTFSFTGVTSDYVAGNDTVVREIAKFPDRFVGLATVNPHYSHLMTDELDRCRANGLRGIKLIADYQKYPTDGPGLFPAYEYAHEHSWIILNHNWGSPDFLDKLATTFTNACFIIGHYVGPIYGEVVTRRENVFQCTCAALNFGDIENMLDVMPVEKVMFGSDFTDLPVMFSMGPILYARISDDDKRAILGLTAKSVLEHWNAMPGS